jgi:deferrochelatase/peroxidase EfeB
VSVCTRWPKGTWIGQRAAGAREPDCGDVPAGPAGSSRYAARRPRVATVLALRNPRFQKANKHRWTWCQAIGRIASCVRTSHRILRRGREFGNYLAAEEAASPDAADPRSGLHFICLNANISRQFEFIQNAWLMNSKFDGLNGESDPLLSGEPTDKFGLPQPNSVVRRLAAMPQFVTVAGGGYFFLPGVRTLHYLAVAARAL